MPDKAEIVMAALGERFGITHLMRPNGQQVALAAPMMFMGGEDEGREPRRGYDIVAGVAVVQVDGTLVHKNGTLRPYSGMTGYDGIRLNVLQALEDPKVKGIMLDIDSPGGECAGLFDLVDTIRAVDARKPVWAALNECAASAAYAIASAARRVTIPRTGVAGSIGVVWMHVDFSQALTDAGIAVTLLQFGAKKTDGNEFAPLAKEAAASIQADIDASGTLFVNTVARNRKMQAAAVKATEAGTFMGAAAVKAGLADVVMAPDAALHAFVSSL
ncbi:MAG: S49 family peptidase [Proteobacteria bacterium]|nr:S49 family peptidase [Pseudomonadota bacterium]